MRSAKLAITSLISSKRQWNNFLLNSLNSKSLEVRNTSEKKKRKSEQNRKKLDEDAMLCNTWWSERPFRVFLNVRIDLNFPQNVFFLFRDKYRFLLSMKRNLFSMSLLGLNRDVKPYAVSSPDWLDRIVDIHSHGYETPYNDDDVPISCHRPRYINIASDGSLNIPPYLKNIFLEFEQYYENTRYKQLER